MSVSKTYMTNKELGLNQHGVKPPKKTKGIIPPSAPKSPHHIANQCGTIRPCKRQTGWRVRCSQVGSQGGFELTVGNHIHKTIMPGMGSQVDFTIDYNEIIRVDHIGMQSLDWGVLVVSREY